MNQIKKNYIYNIIYQILLLILPLITSPYISRIMKAEKIGEYSFAYSVSTYFGLFILLGLNNYGNRTIASLKNSKNLSNNFWSIYTLQLLIGLFVIFIYLIYTICFSSDMKMFLIHVIYLLSVVIDINWFYYGMEKFKFIVIRNIIIKIITVIFIFIFIKTSTDIYKYAFLISISTLCSQLILWKYIYNYVKFEKINTKDILKHLKPNLKLFLPVIAISLYTLMSKILLGILSTTEEVGYYESVYKIMSVPLMAVTSLGIVMLPRVSNLISEGRNKESTQYLYKSLVFTVFLSTPMAFGLCAISNQFIPLFFGLGFEKCINILPLMMLSTIFMSWANVIRTQYLIPNKKDTIYLSSTFLGALFNIILNLIMIPNFGSVGAAFSTFCTEFIVCAYQTIKISKNLNIKLYLKLSSIFIIIGIIMYILTKAMPFVISDFLTIIIKIISGLIIYMFLSFLYYKFIIKKLVSYYK